MQSLPTTRPKVQLRRPTIEPRRQASPVAARTRSGSIAPPPCARLRPQHFRSPESRAGSRYAGTARVHAATNGAWRLAHGATQASTLAFSPGFGLTANDGYSQDCSILEAPAAIFLADRQAGSKTGVDQPDLFGIRIILEKTRNADEKKPCALGKVFLAAQLNYFSLVSL